ncbi:MAG: amino acid adenylation domain-containing protein, partial [Cyanobacteria bacterium P01_F01_bin.42]
MTQINPQDLFRQMAQLTPEQRAVFEQKLAARGIELPALPILPRSSDEAIPLSFAQQRLWFIQQLEPSSTTYNIASAFKLVGDCDQDLLVQAINGVVARHEIFRTTFETVENQQPVQVIHPYVELPLPYEDLRSQSKETIAAKIAELVEPPFDLTQPILRLKLLQTENQEFILVLATHHIIADRWSVMVFLRELALFYKASLASSPAPLDKLPIQYADWSIWQRQQLQGSHLQKATDYWITQLAGDLPQLDLPRDRSYPVVPTYEGHHYPVAFSPELSEKLRTLAQRNSTTLFTTLLAALKVLLYRYTQQGDIVVGSDIANRDRFETEGLIGLLVNTLVLRTQVAGEQSFETLLTQVRETVLGAFSHGDFPFEKLVELLNPARHLSQMSPLFQVKLDLQQAQVKPLELEGLKLERYPLEETQVKYELRFNLQESEAGITGQVEYSSDLYDEATIARIVGHFEQLLEGIVDNPQASVANHSILTIGELEQLQTWNLTQRDYPTNLCIHQLFEQQVTKTPDAITIRWREQSITYRELDQRANQWAETLKRLGAGTGVRVGVCMTRSPQMITAMLAILKSGASYVPLDPAYPQTRLDFIAKDAQLEILMLDSGAHQSQIQNVVCVYPDSTTRELAVQSDAPESAKGADKAVTPQDLAYIIYTSGSTGTPKGVAIAHQSTVSLLHWALEEFEPEDLETILASTSICFDLSVFEIFTSLSCGGSIYLVDNVLDEQLKRTSNISFINTVPSALTSLMQKDSLPESLKVVALAGESFPPSLMAQLQQKPLKIYNLYGPSEDTTYSTCARLDQQSLQGRYHVPIGKPIANTQAHVLDPMQQPVPLGVIGELYLSGAGLAQGYWQRSELTSEKFVTFPGAQRSYRTGDRVRFLPDGQLEFLGRFDHQLKLRGFRIETGEIEAVLCQHQEIQEAVVMAIAASLDTPQSSTGQLVAFVVASSELSAQVLRHFLSERLPSYMVPQRYWILESLPKLPNGKLDRRTLQQMTLERSVEQPYQAPSTELEKQLADIWQQTLKVDKVGVDDNFFELGGHSLLAVSLMAQVQSDLDCSIPLKQLFQTPTVAGLATAIESKRFEPAKIAALPKIVEDQDSRYEPFPLTDIQQAYWIGRSQAFELGNVSTHGYREMEAVGLPIDVIEQALQQLIDRHDMLRMVTNGEGQQQVLPKVSPYQIPRHDFRNLKPEQVEQELLALRDRLSHQMFNTEQWPLFGLEAAQYVDANQEKVRFYISFDVLIGDARSFQLLGQEIGLLLLQQTLNPLTLSFRDYVLAEKEFQKSETYAQDWDYWRSRLDTLPAAPDLPLIKQPSTLENPKFNRRSDRLSIETWQKVKQQGQRLGLTPSGILLAVFSEILALWSRNAQFTLNLTLFNRQPIHPEVNQIVGDFTASLLLAIDYGAGSSTFINRAKRLQTQLWDDLEHRQVSGVQVLRELAKIQQRPQAALMPVVFTSTLNQPIPERNDCFCDVETVFSVSQTSQVYWDHQVSEIAGELVFNWDTIDDLFPP